MELFSQVFDHQPSYRIIVCRNCAIAIPPKQILTHLRDRHPRVPVAERRAIAAAARELRDLAWQPEDLRLPARAKRPIQGLVDNVNGLVCQSDGCMYTCTSKQGITAHCKAQHGWKNNQKRGGDARKKKTQPANRIWADNQPCQRVFRASGWPAYMALRASVPRRNADDLLEKVKADRTRIEEEEAAAAAQDTIKEGRRQLPNPWLELTGWLSHLKGRQRAALLCARSPPEDHGSRGATLTEDDAALENACHAMRRLVRKAFRASRPEVVGRPALELIEQRETGADTNEKPFYSYQRASTIQRYSEKLIGILCYLWRTCDATRPPPYEFSSNQAAHMEKMKRLAQHRGKRGRRSLEQTCLRFWIALLDHSLADDEYKNALLSGVAVLGLKPDHLGGGWCPAHEFSPALSALITTSKALVLYSALREHLASKEQPENTVSVHELVRDMAERFMKLSGYQGCIVAPMNRLLRLRTLARSIAKQRNTEGVVSWDGKKILVDRQSFTMLDLQSMIKGLCETVRLRLLTDVLLLEVNENGEVRPTGAALPPLSLNTLVDQPAELAAGFSFLKHPDNHFDAWRDWLLHRVIREPRLQRRFRAGADAEAWCDEAVHAYMKGVRRFKEGLFALVHLSAGAPARGTEITSILSENDVDGIGCRGVFVHGGLVSFVTTYHKGYSFSKRVKTIHRYVPHEVSELVVYYLALARPFIVDLQKMHYGVKGSSPFIWEPPPDRQADIDSDGDSGCEESEAGDDDIDAWGCESDVSVEDTAEEERHPAAIAEKRRSANPDGYWGPDRVRRVLREYTLEFMNTALGTRAWRHAYPAIHRELATDSQSCEMLDMLYYDKDPVSSDARALQSGHTLRTEESSYGRLLTESPHQTYREREQFRSVSVEWHRLLGFASAWNGRDTHRGVLEARAGQHKQLAFRRWEALASADLQAEFRALVKDPAAKFRSKQEEGLQAVCQRRLRVLVVMATGAGKSMLFILPAAMANSGVTVVIAPLNSLRDNMLDRCEAMGIRCAKWDGRRPPYWANVVLVTPEAAVGSSFGRFLDEKRSMRALDRIVIDECHVLLESSSKWRPDVLKLTQMTEKDTQVVYLTATLPPVLQPQFMQVAGLDERSLTVCRDKKTTRPNIAYSLLPYRTVALEATLQQLVARKRTKYGPDAQIIVYCPSRDSTRSLAKQLRCVAYASDMGTDEEKAARVRSFASGVVKLCTATNMLGLGLDAPGVRVVIHVAMCFEMRQYVQESGRAGRTGLPSDSIVLVPSWPVKSGGTKLYIPPRLDDPAKAFLSSTTCRRIAIDAHMDGREDRTQCEVGEAKCDLCDLRTHSAKRPLSPAMESDAPAEAPIELSKLRRLEASVAQEERGLETIRRREADQRAFELEQLERHLTTWRGACALCLAVTGEREEHRWEACQTDPNNRKLMMMHHLKTLSSASWDPFASCGGCRVPQAICNRWEETDEQGAFRDRCGGLCQYNGVLLPAVAAIMACHWGVFRRWMAPVLNQANMRAVPQTQEKLRAVLGRRAKLGQRDASQAACLFFAWCEGRLQPPT